MCGRYNVTPNAQAFLEAFDIVEGLDTLSETPRYNVAPGGDPVPVVRTGPRGRALCALRWPLVPRWAREGRGRFSTVNAKGETLADKASFRDAWRRGRRCLIPAHGYYEWRRDGAGKQPYHIQLPGGALFAFGGLWDRCETAAGQVIESCTIITTPPAPELAAIHDRMPLIVPPPAYADWLEGAEPGGRIKPFDAAPLEAYPVSTRVNNPRHDDPRCLERTP